MTFDIEALREAAIKATPQDLDSAEVVRKSGGYIDCPICDGEGSVETGNDYCNFDNVAIGVQFYGIGQEHVRAEEYYRMARPEQILLLIQQRDELLAALKHCLMEHGGFTIRGETERMARAAIANAEKQP